MPWKELSVFDQRLAFVKMVLSQELNIAQACREFGISRPTGYRFLQRYGLEGEEGLRERSRAPLHPSQAIENAIADQILAVRTRFPTWGPKKIRAYLQTKQPEQRWPAASTIGERLTQAGMVHKRRLRRRSTAWPLTPIGHANQVWCADYKGQFPLSCGTLCYPLTLTDGASRYLLRCQALADTTTDRAWPVFAGAFHEFGLPQIIRTDNGAPFAWTTLAGLSRLALWWIKLGILPERIAAGHPEQNGRHERMHKTLKTDILERPEATLSAQQRGFDRYRALFNHERPHEALEHKTPASCYAPSDRPYPRRLPSLQYPEGMTVRKVRPNGCLRLRGQELYVSHVLAGEPVGLDPFEEGRIALWVGFLPVAILLEATMAFLPHKKAANYLQALRQEALPTRLNV